MKSKSKLAILPQTDDSTGAHGGCCSAHEDAREASPVCAEWQSAAADLGARSFASFEEAVAALVEVILKRMGDEPGMDRDDAKAFLEDLLITDPQLEDELRKTLTIRGE